MQSVPPNFIPSRATALAVVDIAAWPTRAGFHLIRDFIVEEYDATVVDHITCPISQRSLIKRHQARIELLYQRDQGNRIVALNREGNAFAQDIADCLTSRLLGA